MYIPFEDKDVVNYPCPHHQEASAVEFNFEDSMQVSEAKERDEVREIDLDTFIRVNHSLGDNTELRWYNCSECDKAILFFPDSYAKYVV